MTAAARIDADRRQPTVTADAAYRSIVAAQTELVALALADGTVQFVNDAYSRLLGETPEAIRGRPIFEFINEAERERVAALLQRAASGRGTVEDECQVRLPSGEMRWFAWTYRALRDESDHIVAVHLAGHDIQRRVLAERKLKESEARFRLLAEYSGDMIIHLDRDLTRRYVSPACRELFGYEPEELIGRRSGDAAHPEDAAHLEEALRSLLEGARERHAVISRRMHKDGRWIWVESLYRALKDPLSGQATGIVATVRDISSRKAVEDRLADAYRRLEIEVGQDGLTGLDNRRRFDERYSDEFERARASGVPLGVAMIDVDFFKLFNDRYGHIAGDECLRQVSKAIRASIHRPQDFAARYGGEEFAVLSPGANLQGAGVIAARIREAVRNLSIEHRDSAYGVVTVSVGVASTCSPKFSAQPLLEAADRALYSAKARGRDMVACASFA